MPRALLVGPLRTPFCRAHKGSYADIRPDDLLVHLLQQHRGRYPGLWQAAPEDVIVGCAYPEGEQGYNVARMVALGCQLNSPGVTVNRLCGSSLEAAAIAAARIQAGWGEAYIVGGVESMSRVPRRGANFSVSSRIEGVSPEAYIAMGDTAENLANEYPHHSRTSQEDFAEESHRRAHQAYADGCYDTGVLKYRAERDEFVRFPVDRSKMQQLEPAFRQSGVVTAATSSPLTDGAACGWMIDERLAKQMEIEEGLEILDVTVAHVAPEIMGLGPVPAVRAIFERNQLTADAVSAYEINEAFAIQMLVTMEELRLPADRVNAWGGAIALGHPLGATGLRLLGTLHDRLRAEPNDKALGIAALCVGGGQGMALLCRKWQSASA